MTEEELKISIDNLASALKDYSQCMNQVYITMFGVDGQGGCLQKHKEDQLVFESYKEKVSQDFRTFKEDEYQPFKNRVTMVLVAIAVGSGGTGVGIGIGIGKTLFGG